MRCSGCGTWHLLSGFALAICFYQAVTIITHGGRTTANYPESVEAATMDQPVTTTDNPETTSGEVEEDLSRQDGTSRICFAVQEAPGMGGLSNAFAFQNAILEWAVKTDSALVFAGVHPVGHGLESSFVDMLADGPLFPEDNATVSREHLVEVKATRGRMSKLSQALAAMRKRAIHSELCKNTAKKTGNSANVKGCDCLACKEKLTKGRRRLGMSEEDFPEGTITYHWDPVADGRFQSARIGLVPPEMAPAVEGVQPQIPLLSAEFLQLVKRQARPLLLDKRPFASAYYPKSWGCTGPDCCNYVVEVPLEMRRYHHRFEVTQGPMRHAYHRHDPKGTNPPPPTALHVFRDARPITVALHHRVGDVKERVYNWWSKKKRSPMTHEADSRQVMDTKFLNKMMSVTWPIFVLASLQKVVEPSCLSMFILTEDDPESRQNLQLLRRMFPKLHFTSEAAFPPSPAGTHPARVAFDVLAHASVVIAGQSGFSRLSAMLTRGTAVVVDEAKSMGHSMDEVKGNIVRVQRRPLFWSTAGLPGMPMRHLLLQLEKARKLGARQSGLRRRILAALQRQGLEERHPECFL